MKRKLSLFETPSQPTKADVVHLINSIGIGGAERQLSLIAGKAQDRGVRQTVVPLVRANPRADMSGVDVHPGGENWQVLRSLARVIELLRVRPRPVLIAWMYHSWAIGLVASMLTGGKGKLLLYCRHSNYVDLPYKTRVIAWACLNLAKWRSLRVVFNSHAAKEAHLRKFPGLQSVVIPNGIGLRAATFRDRGRAIGFLGRNHSDKGADLLPNLLANVLRTNPEWCAEVAGPGMDALLSSFVREFSLAGVSMNRLLLTGAIPNPEEFLQRVSVVVVPSRTESFPNVVIEALAYGALPVCMAVGDIPDIVEDRSLLASSKNELLDKLNAVCLRSSSEISNLSKRIWVTAESRFGIDHIVDRHLALWADEGLK